MLALGAAGILAVVVSVMAFIDMGREKQYMTQILQEKGAALIKAFEAGARTGLRGGFGANIRLQHLLEETASQPGILFIAVTDASGRILAHSDVSRIGQQLFSGKDIAELAPKATEQWRLIGQEGIPSQAFMVYRHFTPTRGGHPFHGGLPHGPPPQGHQFFCTDDCDSNGAPRDLLLESLEIFVGLDVAHI